MEKTLRLTGVVPHHVLYYCEVTGRVPSAIRASVICLWSFVDLLVFTAFFGLCCFIVTVETPIRIPRYVYCAVLLHMADFLKLERASLAFESSSQLTVQQLVSKFISLIERYVLTVFTFVDNEVVFFPYVPLEVLKASSSVFTYSAAVKEAVFQMLLIALSYSQLSNALRAFGWQNGSLLSICAIRLSCCPAQQFLFIN